MTDTTHTPTFNMKVVVQETGLKPDTLRAWERRYGMPNPERTSGGHRLYSQYEIDALKWLIARQEEGLSISHAVDLWNQLKEEGKNPLLTHADSAVQESIIPVSGDRINEVRQMWIDACLDFDQYRTQQILAQAFAVFPIETVCFEILQKGLTEIGAGWYEGEVTVQQEHFASALALRQLEVLLASAPAPTRPGRLVLACPPMEHHTFSPLLLALMLRRRGWDVVYLGADVPLDRLASTVKSIEPDLVVASAQTLYTASTLLTVAQLLRKESVSLAFGGGVFNTIDNLYQHIPGYFLGDSLEEAPQQIEKLLSSQPPLPKFKDISPTYQAALDHFIETRLAIEADLQKHYQGDSLPLVYLNTANRELGNNIEAALRLGDISLLTANIEWIEGLLVHHHYSMPKESLRQYLATYAKAVKANMDQRRRRFDALLAEPDQDE